MRGADGTPLRVGVDLCAVADVAASIEAFGDAYLDRVFTPCERADAAGSPEVVAGRLAARFAAKEATVKALRVVGEPALLRDIEVVTAAGGAPVLALHRRASALAEAAGLTSWAVSLSHEGALAVAVVVATGPGEAL